MSWYVKKTCESCGGEFVRHRLARFCFPCCEKRARQSNRRSCRENPNELARRLVSTAIRLGVMRPAKEFSCVDCGKPAAHYDHRDYNKPLDVDPVCLTCHGARGRGIMLVIPVPGPLAQEQSRAA